MVGVIRVVQFLEGHIEGLGEEPEQTEGRSARDWCDVAEESHHSVGCVSHHVAMFGWSGQESKMSERVVMICCTNKLMERDGESGTLRLAGAPGE